MRQAILMLTCGAAVLLAGDPWKEKKPSEWTEKESAKILTNSPWAKTVTAEMTGRSGGGGRGGGGSTSGGRRGGGGGMSMPSGSGGLIGSGDGGPSGGGPEGPGGTPAGPKVTVRWETSEPLLEAFEKVEYTLVPKLREWSRTYYVITATGMPVRMGGRQRPGAPSQAEQAPPDPKQLMERFVQASMLKRKGKDPIAPERIEMLRVGESMVPMFFFPRKDAITAEDKEVTFESAFGPVTVKSKFNLKDMLYDGKLSL